MSGFAAAGQETSSYSSGEATTASKGSLFTSRPGWMDELPQTIACSSWATPQATFTIVTASVRGRPSHLKGKDKGQRPHCDAGEFG